VPYGGILVTLFVYLIGVGLNYLVPSQVFEIVLNIASLGIVSTWAFIVVCQLKLRAAQDAGDIARVSFRMPFSPWSSWLTLGFLASVLVLMAFDYPVGTWTMGMSPLVALALVLGWFALRRADKQG
jgi:L-asparagine permease